MLPLEHSWYRKLLVFALALGAAGGLWALLFMGVVDTGTGFFFGDAGTGWWTGAWWWVPLTALGGLAVAVLRTTWTVSPTVPGAIAIARQAWIDTKTAPSWVAISVVSLIFGASLGPSFALVVMGGAFGSWLVTRLGIEDDEAKHEYTLTGMAGGLGSAFAAPIFATVLASELSPTPKENYLAAFIPELFGATVGALIFYGVTGSAILGSYPLPAFEFQYIHLLIGALLGVLAAVVLILFALISKAVSVAFEHLRSPPVRGAVGGALVGLIAWALPLTATGGTTQLATELQISAALGSGFLAAVLIAKMVAVALSQSSGFLGGMVFPMIFVGGTAGLLVHSLFPGIPIALCVGAMLAAVPGAFLTAPVALVLIAFGTVGIAPEAMVPVGLAVVTAHITVSLFQTVIARRHSLALEEEK
ncbi:chloride channel protein [Methanofollis ethanolicus]|uniref:chloride channel protein n=1 Tax=Methanofollis ethanolicus TaxID=488124 RepID=UPI00128F6C77|nr:chloride channel protein [Methanofollis ethanolicus]